METDSQSREGEVGAGSYGGVRKGAEKNCDEFGGIVSEGTRSAKKGLKSWKKKKSMGVEISNILRLKDPRRPACPPSEGRKQNKGKRLPDEVVMKEKTFGRGGNLTVFKNHEEKTRTQPGKRERGLAKRKKIQDKNKFDRGSLGRGENIKEEIGKKNHRDI